MILLVLSVPLVARYHSVTSVLEFERLVDSYPYSVACFAPTSEQEGEDLTKEDLKDTRRSFKELKDILQASASKHQFKKFLPKDIGFILVDATAKRAQALVDKYNITDMPVCYVFNYGEKNEEHVLTNPDSTKDILDLLSDAGGDDLKELIADRKEEENQERQETIARYYAYGGYYPYSWGYGFGGSSYWAQPYYGWNWLW